VFDAARGVTVADDHAEQHEQKRQQFGTSSQLQGDPLPTTAMCYNFRPYGFDPDKCIGEAFVLELFPEGEAPATDWIHTPVDAKEWLHVLHQDFSNMTTCRRG